MHSKDFIHYCIKNSIIKTGNFTLKSGRSSPYFFNSGLFNNGEKLSVLISAYCEVLTPLLNEFDILFGPAYKGISLASAISLKLYEQTGVSKGYCYDRKEIKTHGEGGKIVGSELAGKTILVDDVMTAGSTIAYARKLFTHYPKATLAGIVLAFDRMERVDIKGISSIPIYSISNADELCEVMGDNLEASTLRDYLQKYRRSITI